MIDPRDTHSLADFQRNTNMHVKRLKRTGRPLVLTVNGQAEIVVQDAAAYQKLVDALDRAEAVASIRRGLEVARRGEEIVADEVLDDIRQTLRVPPARSGTSRKK